MCKPCARAGDLVWPLIMQDRGAFVVGYLINVVAEAEHGHKQCADPHTCSCQHRVPVL